jgi:hypothetical protein
VLPREWIFAVDEQPPGQSHAALDAPADDSRLEGEFAGFIFYHALAFAT